MPKAGRWILLGGLILGSVTTQARVFQYGKEKFASYLRGNIGEAWQGEDPYKKAGSSAVTYSKDAKYQYNYAYEFGFIYSFGYVNLRFGLEFLRPDTIKGAGATNSSDVSWYSVTNEISGYAPKAGLEIILKQWGRSRVFLSGDYGQATMTIQNSYTFSSAGTTATGLSDFREEISGTAPLMEGSLGFETLLSDTTTLVLDAGYRSLVVDSFSHKVAHTGFQGVMADGTAATNTDGTKRSLDLSGGFASLALRIWIK